MPGNKRGIEAGRAFVKAYLDDSLFVRGLKGMQKSFRAVGASLTRIGGTMIGAGAGIGALFIKPIRDAGEMQAALASFDTIFKSSANEMGAWGDALAKELGRSTTEVRKFMTMTQGRLLAAGVDEGTANQINKQLTTRAFDLAQFWDKDDQQAFQAMQNALTGEMEAMKAFGIVISKADQDAKLRAMGLDPGTASQAEKVQARFDLLLQRSAEVQGTAARESGEYSSLLKRLGAEFQSVSESIGAALLPTVTRLMQIFAPLIGQAAEWIKSNSGIVTAVAGAAAGAVVAGAAIAGLGIAFTVASSAFGAGATALGLIGSVIGAVLSPVGLLVGGLVAVGGYAAYVAYESGALGEALDWLKARFGPLLDIAKKAFAGIKAAISAGDFKAAAALAWMGLRAAFLRGKIEALKIWDAMLGGFRDSFDQTFAGLVGKFVEWGEYAKAIVHDVMAALSRSRAAFADLIGNDMGEAFRAQADADETNAFALRRGAESRGRVAMENQLAAAADRPARRARQEAEAKEAQANFEAAAKAAKDAAEVAEAARAQESRGQSAPAAKAPAAPMQSAFRAAQPAINTAAFVGTSAGMDAVLRATHGFGRQITPGEKLIADKLDETKEAVESGLANAVVLQELPGF